MAVRLFCLSLWEDARQMQHNIWVQLKKTASSAPAAPIAATAVRCHMLCVLSVKEALMHQLLLFTLLFYKTRARRTGCCSGCSGGICRSNCGCANTNEHALFRRRHLWFIVSTHSLACALNKKKHNAAHTWPKFRAPSGAGIAGGAS